MKTKIAAIGDIHIDGSANTDFTKLFTEISAEADILVLAGDLTTRGLVEEAKMLAHQLASCTIPVVGVLGNHDYEGGKENEIVKILNNERITILEGQSKIIDDVGFAGIKGFAGGFDGFMLTPWGEKPIKDFVKVVVDEVLSLENEIARLTTEKKVVIMHYSPTRSTVEGEPLEIMPFLGSSRFAEPINRLGVTVVFHGHAHSGTHEGKTSENVPVYNVSYPLLQKRNPEKPYAIYEI